MSYRPSSNTTSTSSPLHERAEAVYRAIHGTTPPYVPYKGASDHPFQGIDPLLVAELLNRDEVEVYIKKHRAELAKKHNSIGVYTYVGIKKPIPLRCISMQCSSKWVLVYHLQMGWVRYFPISIAAPRVPDYGERDLFKSTLKKTIQHGHEYTCGKKVKVGNREGIIIEDFSNPLGYTDPCFPIIPFSGVVDFNTHTEFLSINAVQLF